MPFAFTEVLHSSLVFQILDDKTAASFVDGIAVHWYEDFLFSAQILSTTHEHHPTKFILPSEVSKVILVCPLPNIGVERVVTSSWS